MSNLAGKYRIGAVSRMTGISTHALRVWERRYRAVEPVRTPGGDRLFSDRDVIRLRSIKSLIERGHPVSHVARLEDDALFALLDEGTPEGPASTTGDDELRAEFMNALRGLDLRTANALLSRAASLQPTQRFLSKIVGPLLQEIGDAWADGTLRIAHEHAASAILRNLTGTLSRLEPPMRNAPTVVATTLSGELHEFGVLMAALTAAAHRWNVVYLGPNLPADEIVHAVQASGAELLFLSFVNDQLANTREIDRLVERLPPLVGVVLGGAAAPAVMRRFGQRDPLASPSSMRELERWLEAYERDRVAVV